jgi:predicted SpoU family rRNA methylase
MCSGQYNVSVMKDAMNSVKVLSVMLSRVGDGDGFSWGKIALDR